MFVLARTLPTNSLVLCKDGEFHSERFVGRKVGMTARTWTTRAGAERYAAQRWNAEGRNYCTVVGWSE